MATANKEQLESFFTGSNQFKIPFFQRAYVWKEENWSELWDDVLEELEQLRSGNNKSEHFIGTIIVKLTDTGNLRESVYELIDGQQRLTTVCILLRALQDASQDVNLKKWLNDFLVFSDSYGKKSIRLIHSKIDSNYFHQVILSENDNEKLLNIPETKIKIFDSYIFFRNKIDDIIQENIRDVADIVLKKLVVVHMALNPNDDVQQIFDTINSLGVKLTTGELLKNYLYSFKELKPYYETYWKNIFEKNEETIQFWDEKKTSGRISRFTIELFLYS